MSESQVEVGMPNKLPQFYPRFKSYRTRIKQSLYDKFFFSVDIKIFKVSTTLKSSTYTLVTRSNNGAALGTMIANNARDENTYKYKR